MQVGRRFKLWETLNWSKVSILVFLIWGTVPVFVYNVLGWHWVHLPWQPISLIGIAVAFYLGFKNNSSYDRLWEARKIWGGIVNTSRSFAVMARDWVNNDTVEEPQSEEHLNVIRKEIVHRHVAWLHALAIQLRKVKPWEHNSNKENEIRRELGMDFHEDKFMQINPYLSSKEFD
ncbi:MAG: hypothetical protein HKN09_02675 [Saprospiraceae bacterium]|nr:hypothetical protein [Saprospiraceae bacterium]